MNYSIKDLRLKTGLTQNEFAKRFSIPISTLRKWEQGEASPAPYLVRMIAEGLPALNLDNLVIHGRNGKDYYYDETKSKVYDEIGNEILISEKLDTVKKENLPIYLEDLFEEFYRIQEKFNRDCRFDGKEDIIWTRKDV